MQKLHISLVIPAYNEELYLAQCLDAVMIQTLKPNVIYIVDNNSTDGTRAIAEGYNNVHIIRESTQGICAATKKGLDVAAKHEGIILRCDADCQPQSDWVEKTAALLTDNISVVAVTGPGIAYDTGRVARFLIHNLYMKAYFQFIGLALGKSPLFGSNFGIRADEWRRISNTTHLRSYQNIHDDIDISYHLQGESLYDASLVMPMSARPFRNFRKIPHRYRAGFRSVFIHWPDQAPWKNKKL